MAPKGKKKDPNAPTLIPEDTYLRARKLLDMKVPMGAPKDGVLKDTEYCVPPQLHTMPEFKQVIQFWKQCAIVQYSERKVLTTPSRLKGVEDEATMKKPHPLKELKDLFKYMKSQVKQANKRTGQFLKQLEKKEGKEMKREALLKQIADVDRQMNDELRSARRFTEKQELFEKKYMVGSKLGESGPRKHALILVECSDKQMQWVEETKDEITKLINEVLKMEESTETLNLATFSGAGQTLWCPQFQAKDDPKKGIADAEKWLKKTIAPKVFSAQAYPPDYCGMLTRLTGEGQTLPWRIYMCCSRRPEGNAEEVLQMIRDLRANNDPPAKGETVLPMNIVAFDPTIVGDDDEKNFFEELAGPAGSFMIDTSAEDLKALDTMLRAVQVKKKQLDKLNKKLDKMEDLSERVTEDRAHFQVQVSLQRMLEEDLAIIDWAMKNDAQPAGPEI